MCQQLDKSGAIVDQSWKLLGRLATLRFACEQELAEKIERTFEAAKACGTSGTDCSRTFLAAYFGWVPEGSLAGIVWRHEVAL